VILVSDLVVAGTMLVTSGLDSSKRTRFAAPVAKPRRIFRESRGCVVDFVYNRAAHRRDCVRRLSMRISILTDADAFVRSKLLAEFRVSPKNASCLFFQTFLAWLR